MSKSATLSVCNYTDKEHKSQLLQATNILLSIRQKKKAKYGICIMAETSSYFSQKNTCSNRNLFVKFWNYHHQLSLEIKSLLELDDSSHKVSYGNIASVYKYNCLHRTSSRILAASCLNSQQFTDMQAYRMTRYSCSPYLHNLYWL